MSDWLKMTRRRCLSLVVGLVAAISWSWLSPRRSEDDLGCEEEEAARWRRQLRSPESAVIVGHAYLAVVPQTNTELIADLAAAVGQPSGGVLDLTDDELRRQLRDRVRLDYGENRTVRLRGWTVSRTEAQLCALCALGEVTTS